MFKFYCNHTSVPKPTYLQATIDFGTFIHRNEDSHQIRAQYSIFIPVSAHNKQRYVQCIYCGSEISHVNM